jgi:tripartite ATP-independent transporter DctM subunit
MFMAAVIPGFLLVALYLIWIVLIAVFRPHLAPPMPAEELAAFRGKGMFGRILRAFVLPFSLILAVLGSIFAGIASPTEAAAVGAFGATLLTILQGKFNLQTLKAVLSSTTSLTCMDFILLVGATAFGLVFRGMHGDRYITDLILGSNLSPHAFLFLVMLVVFVAGFFIDFIEIIFIIVPVVAPIFTLMGDDLLWVGILLAVNLQTSFLTPPFGFSLFYLKGVAPPEVTTGHLYRGIIPFILIQLSGLAIIIIFPETVSWLPNLLSK